MSGEGLIAAARPARAAPVLPPLCATCANCATGRMANGDPAAALPDGWDALFLSGDGLALFCDDCVASGRMEQFRALAGAPRHQSWRYPGAVLALYRPSCRDILVATPDGMAAISVADAAALTSAIASALATRTATLPPEQEICA